MMRIDTIKIAIIGKNKTEIKEVHNLTELKDLRDIKILSYKTTLFLKDGITSIVVEDPNWANYLQKLEAVYTTLNHKLSYNTMTRTLNK